MSIKKEKRINLANALLSAIADGKSSIAENISREYSVSKVSVYKYLSLLEKENIIARTGRGSYELLREDVLYGDVPRFTLIAGVNGTGKSSFSGVMQESDEYLKNIVDVDKITWEIKGIDNKFPTKAEELRAAKKAIRMIRSFLENEESFAQETTLAGRSILNTVKSAKEKGYRIRMFYIGVDGEAECKRRIKNRVKKGGHNILDSDVEQRYAKRSDALWRVLPYVDEAEFYDNNNGFRKVAKLKDGEIIPIVSSPRWLSEIIQNPSGKKP